MSSEDSTIQVFQVVMEHQRQHTITRLLASAGEGDSAAREQLWLEIYRELRRVAQNLMAREAPGRTLQPTALLHEAYLRLVGGKQVNWVNRKQFFHAAAKLMRQILVDDARRRKRKKRAAGGQRQPMETAASVFDQEPNEVLGVNDALAKLAETDKRKAEIVTLKYFAGLTGEEIAAVLGVSPTTVDVDWKLARAWLHRELADEGLTGGQ